MEKQIIDAKAAERTAGLRLDLAASRRGSHSGNTWYSETRGWVFQIT
jgi:hypothetical protein